MRPIKFRAWDKMEKRMIPHNLLMAQQYARPLDDNIFNDDTHIVMQFTGLHDKNGREIYEGDIVRLEAGVWSDVAEVVFNNGCFILKCDYWYWSGRCISAHYGEYEVIGNIYENPKLLEKQ